MSRPGSKLQTRRIQVHANMTEQNHLGLAFRARPYEMQGVMDEVFSGMNQFAQNPLSSDLMGNAMTEETISQTEWEWELRDATIRPLVIIENVEPVGNITPGKFIRTFKMKLDKDWYVPGDVLSPGTSSKKNSVRIQEGPQKHGDGFVYTVILQTTNGMDFLDKKYLSPGVQWHKMYSNYEEASSQAGSTQFSMPIAFRNKMSKYKKSYMITDMAAQEVLAVAVPDSNGKMHRKWMKYAEVEFWKQWYREKEIALWYSRSTDTVLGANGRPVRSGPGVQEMLEDSNVATYSNFSMRLLEEYIMDIFYAKVSPSDQTHLKVYTGQYGMNAFHTAVTDVLNSNGFLKNVEPFMGDVSSPYHSNAKSFGYKFVQYKMANGVTVDVVHNPLYDDLSLNSEVDEITGKPIESMRFTFLDFSGDNGKSNIKIMKKEGASTLTYVNGSIGPDSFTPGAQGSAHDGDFYKMTVADQFGLHIHDVSKCGELIFKRSA